MTFTDDELKQLKAEVYSEEGDSLTREQIKALLARLETAEKMYPYKDHTPECTVDFDHCCSCGYEAWLLAAGKEKGE